MSIIISKGGKQAQRVERCGFEGENALQQYVYDNPGSIPVQDIKEGARLLVVKREFPTDSGPLDALAVDSEGDIYCIETKLHKNPDKRAVVAQVLDYGASMWHDHDDFSDFVAILDAFTQKTHRQSFSELLKSFFGLDDEGLSTLLTNLSVNLQDGKFKFVVLMDRVHEQLKNLVLFLNQNSRFDLYAVEMEFYRHEGYEILIPKLFGAEVRKEVDAQRRWSVRRNWDETSFFDEVRRLVDPQFVPAVTRIYEFSKENADDVGWGTGSKRATFNPRFSSVAQKSLFTVRSDGQLRINLGWLNLSESEQQFKDEFRNRLATVSSLNSLENTDNYFSGFQPEQWARDVEAIIAAIRDSVRECATTSVAA